MRLSKPNIDLHRLSVVLAASQCRKYAGSNVRPTLARYMDPLHVQTNYCVCEQGKLGKGLLANKYYSSCLFSSCIFLATQFIPSTSRFVPPQMGKGYMY